MKILPKELFERYKSDPLKYDEEVRQFADVPENRYYNVIMWSYYDDPHDRRAGKIYIRSGADAVRTVKSKKISKSDQG